DGLPGPAPAVGARHAAGLSAGKILARPPPAGAPRLRPSSRANRGSAMTDRPTDRPNVFPCFKYRDAPAAIDWLGRAFGFTPALVVPGEDGTVVHAELRNGAGMVMCGTQRPP